MIWKKGSEMKSATVGNTVKKQPIVTYPMVFWIFMIGNVAGFILEGLWNIITRGYWESLPATVWGPFSLVYGIGAVLLYLVAIPLKKRNFFIQFAVYALVGSVLEYAVSLFQEVCFGSKSWNYSHHFMNLNGRISLPMALIWGALGLVFVKLIFPFITKLLMKMRGKGWKIACITASVYMALNLSTTASALLRWGERLDMEPPSNKWEAFLDEHYDHDRMRDNYPTMYFFED